MIKRLALLLLISNTCFSSEETDLLAVLAETTEIATKTKMNADYVPGMVTVLKGIDLEAKGVHTVSEAINLVPGMQYLESWSRVNVRGVSAFSSGMLKVMVDGVPINDTFDGLGISVYKLPIQVVDRIEVVRGPGATTYGEYAISGVVNVITYKDTDKVYGQLGSLNSSAEGALLHQNLGDIHLNAVLHNMQTDGSDRILGQDRLGSLPISNAPGKANDYLGLKTAMVTADYHSLQILFQYFDRESGDGTGIMNMLPPNGENHATVPEKTTVLQVQQSFNFLDTDFKLKVGSKDYSYAQLNSFVAPAHVLSSKEMRVNLGTSEEKLYTSLDASRKYGDNTLLVNLEYYKTHLYDVFTEASWLPAQIPPFVSYSSPRPVPSAYQWLLQNPAHRTLTAVSFQDQWQINDSLSLTAGGRFDSYDDVGNSFSPRVALVYSLDQHNIFKTQYATSFRPPTFLEMYSNNIAYQNNPKILPETVETTELGYVYRDASNTLKITVFDSEYHDMINATTVAGITTQKNVADVSSVGTEIEFKKLFQDIKLNSSISYANTVDSYGGKVPGSVDWTGEVDITYSVNNTSINVLNMLVGPANLGKNNTNDSVPGYMSTDITLSQNLYKGLVLRTGIKNCFDKYYTEYAETGTYKQNYPQLGRTEWISLSYDF